MHVELQNIALIGLGTTVDLEKLAANSSAAEHIAMNISSNLRFPEPDRVECLVTMASRSEIEAIRFQCTYQGVFSLSVDPEQFESEQSNISAMCTAKMFPYIKELVADITRRLPMTAPITLSPALGNETALLSQMNLQSTGASQQEETKQ